MAVWIKIINPSVETADGHELWGVVVIDLERVDAFGVPGAGQVAAIIDGKSFIIHEEADQTAYHTVLAYAQRLTGKSLT